MKGELVVFVRIGLYVLAGRAVAGGWLPPELQSEVVSPAMVEAVTGVVLGAGAVVWYWVSKARAALKAAITGTTEAAE